MLIATGMAEADDTNHSTATDVSISEQEWDAVTLMELTLQIVLLVQPKFFILHPSLSSIYMSEKLNFIQIAVVYPC